MEPAAACGGVGQGVEFHNQFGQPEEEFHRRAISVPQGNNDNSSFTALLELPTNQAMELLVHSTHEAAAAAASVTPPPPHLLLPIFSSSNAALVDGAGKFTRLEKSTTNSDSLKQEAEGSDSDPNSNSYSSVLNRNAEQKLNSLTKRKEREKKEKEGSSRKKVAKDEGVEKGDYVHVRARRGQATDSHSLAERARREKINAKMKLLQEMVPGCNKISGTALVLDEIINHVQCLQRQVEILSMRLAAVNTTTNFSFETLMTNQCLQDGSTMGNEFPGTVMMPSDWHEEEQVQKNGIQDEQFWHPNDFLQLNWPPSSNSRQDDHVNFHNPQDSQLAYGSSSISAPLHSNQLKMEL